MMRLPRMEMATSVAPGTQQVGGRLRRRRSLTPPSWVGWLFVLPGLLGLGIFVITPMVGSLVLGLFDISLFGSIQFVGIEGFARLFRDAQFLQSLVVTTIFVFVYTPLNLITALLAALWLQTRLVGKTVLRVIFLIPALSPMVAIAIVFRMLLQNDGAFNAILRDLGLSAIPWMSDGGWALAGIILVSVWQAFGYNMIILAAALDGVDQDVLAAARIDGASALRRLLSIRLPLISPAIFFTSVLTLIGAWQTFAQAQLITGGGPGASTTTIMLYMYRTAFTFNDLGYASAISGVLFIIIALFTIVQVWAQKKWVYYG